MIVISGFIELNPDHVEQARAATLAMMTESGKEDGCIRYRFYPGRRARSPVPRLRGMGDFGPPESPCRKCSHAGVSGDHGRTRRQIA